MELERRVYPIEGIEVREHAGKLSFRGYAAVFNQLSEPIGGQFRERIAHGAFAKTLTQADVKLLINHDPNLLLARSKAGKGTLRLSEDAKGLLVQAEMANTSYARDLAAVMQRGDLDQMSFGFKMVADKWDRSDPNMPIRELRAVDLYDVSAVTMPAYPQTSAAVRSMAARILQTTGPSARRLRPLALSDRQRRERRLEELLLGMAPKRRSSGW